MGQDAEQNADDPSLHEVDAVHDPAAQPKKAAHGEASYGDHYHTRSSEEGFGQRQHRTRSLIFVTVPTTGYSLSK